MIVMTRQRALTIITYNNLKTKWGYTFESPCLRALNLYDGVKGYARLMGNNYLFIADDRQKKDYYGFTYVLNPCNVLEKRCVILSKNCVKLIKKGMWI